MTQQDFVMVADVPQRARKKQAAVKYALLVAVFIILAVAYYYSFRRFARSSDDANILLAGQEMSNGNWRLKGWWLPEDNFLTTHVLLYAILVKCIGFTPYIMFIFRQYFGPGSRRYLWSLRRVAGLEKKGPWQ
jgi:hypothetical protein